MSTGSVTGLLLAWRAGDEAALARLTPLVHHELRRIAQRCLRGERRDHSLPATALVHEAYLKLVDTRQVNWQNRTHFLAMAARLMRRVLVDLARTRRRQKRGAGAVHVSLSEAQQETIQRPYEVEALDAALEALAAVDPRRSQVVELRFFGGLSVPETAAVIGVSADTVMRDWKLARAWLRRELRREVGDDS
jgi:RNA polymerase sigma factor (TIGR02999 family)